MALTHINGLPVVQGEQVINLVLLPSAGNCRARYHLSVDDFNRSDGIALASVSNEQLLELANISEHDLNVCATDLDKRTLLDERADLVARVQTLDIKLGLIDERADEEAEQ